MNNSSFPLGSISATDIKMMLVTYMLFQVDVYSPSSVEIKYKKTEFRDI